MTKEPFWSNKKTNTHFFFSFNPLCIKSFSRLTAHSQFYMLSLPTPPALRVVGVEPSCLQVTTWSFFLRSPIQKPPFKFLLSPRRFSIQFALMFSCAQLLCTKTFQGQFKEPPPHLLVKRTWRNIASGVWSLNWIYNQATTMVTTKKWQKIFGGHSVFYCSQLFLKQAVQSKLWFGDKNFKIWPTILIMTKVIVDIWHMNGLVKASRVWAQRMDSSMNTVSGFKSSV